MDIKEKFEEFIAQYPIFEYRLLNAADVSVHERVRTICREECERYGSTWACPPAVGELPECEKKIHSYSKAIFFSSVAEVSDIMNMEEMLLLDKRTKNLIEDYVPKGDVLEGIVCFFSVFSDYTRVKILSALAISELCVTDMSRLLEINQTTVSHQLRFLKSAGIVKSRRLGKIVFYSLCDDSINDVLLKSVEFLGC